MVERENKKVTLIFVACRLLNYKTELNCLLVTLIHELSSYRFIHSHICTEMGSIIDLKRLLLAFLDHWDNPIDSNPKHTLFHSIVQSVTTIVTVLCWSLPLKRSGYVHGRKNLISEVRQRQTQSDGEKITVKVLEDEEGKQLPNCVLLLSSRMWWCVFHHKKSSSYSIRNPCINIKRWCPKVARSEIGT